jgi:hypothetical protein
MFQSIRFVRVGLRTDRRFAKNCLVFANLPVKKTLFIKAGEKQLPFKM